MDRLTSIVFVLALLVPGLWAVASGPPDASLRKEGRRPSPFPALGTDALLEGRFSRGFEDWFADVQGARADLIGLRNRLWWNGLGLSPSREMVRGADGWIFTTKRAAVPVHRGLLPLTHAELERLRLGIEARARWLAERGIGLMVVVAPNKHSVYPDRLPASATRHGPSHLDQFLGHMVAHSDRVVHDFREVLTAERAFDRPEEGDFTYHPLGTHWTDRGALAAARAIAAHLPEFLPDPPAGDGASLDAGAPPFPAERFERRPAPGPGDTQAGRLHLDEQLVQRVWTVAPRTTGVRVTDVTPAVRRVTNDDPRRPDAVVVHDSFGHALWPYLAEVFHESTFVGARGVDDALVLGAGPDVVVLVIVERNLVGLPDLWPLATDPTDGAGRPARKLY